MINIHACLHLDSLSLCGCVDVLLLRCMVAGAAFADLRGGGGSGTSRQQQQQQKGGRDNARAPTALVIGLGGGALPMALRRMYPGVKVATVELDPEIAGVAKEHFGLKETPDGLKVCCAVLCCVCASRRK